MWEWSLRNVQQDNKEEVEAIAKTFETAKESLKPWLNLELWKAEQKMMEAPPVPSSTYLDELRKRGVSEEEIQAAADTQAHMQSLVDKSAAGSTRSVIIEEDEPATETT